MRFFFYCWDLSLLNYKWPLWSRFNIDVLCLLSMCAVASFITSKILTVVFSLAFQTYRSQLKKGKIMQITKQHIIDSLDDERTVFLSIRSGPVFRSFPSQEHLTTPAARCLQEVLQKKFVPCNLKDEGLRLCYEMGWIHSDVIDENGSEIVCFLPSKLHEK